jgi:hypothetical protein
MSPVPRATIDAVLAPYAPGCRYLQEASIEYPTATGTFQIPRPFYVESTGHFNAVEMILCYNQLAYTWFAEAGRQGLIRELGQVTADEFSKLQLGSALIVTMNNIHFKKPIDASQPFPGTFTVQQITPKRNNTLYFFKTAYDFGDGKAAGEMDLALLRPTTIH